MEIEFQGKIYSFATDDDYNGPKSTAYQLTVEAVQNARKSREQGNTEDAGHWTFTAEWLLKEFWFSKEDEEDELAAVEAAIAQVGLDPR
ncbi:hypothetical protein [Streptomyces sp. NPDC001750]|uniref:hypothetical protein n=1 Tax=Streptomyces sp. NPDC001750 TaxID=3364607 RepID=UPI0036C803AF